MSAAELREAAALMRERAEACPLDARVGSMTWSSTYVPKVVNPDAHFSSWHPAVALAVADWLDGAADFHDAVTKAGGTGLRADNPGALTVARAYLGRAP